jgi:superfamily II DNA/RNA helicase
VRNVQSFADLGLVDVLVEACQMVGWKKPSRIQEEAIPVALQVVMLNEMKNIQHKKHRVLLAVWLQIFDI